MGGILAQCIKPLHGVPCNDTPGIGQAPAGSLLAPLLIGLGLLALLALTIWLAPRLRDHHLH